MMNQSRTNRSPDCRNERWLETIIKKVNKATLISQKSRERSTLFLKQLLNLSVWHELKQKSTVIPNKTSTGVLHEDCYANCSAAEFFTYIGL